MKKPIYINVNSDEFPKIFMQKLIFEGLKKQRYADKTIRHYKIFIVCTIGMKCGFPLLAFIYSAVNCKNFADQVFQSTFTL